MSGASMSSISGGNWTREKWSWRALPAPRNRRTTAKAPPPWPTVIDYGEKCEPVPRSQRVDRIDALDGEVTGAE
jgi:hypothetical protein